MYYYIMYLCDRSIGIIKTIESTLRELSIVTNEKPYTFVYGLLDSSFFSYFAVGTEFVSVLLDLVRASCSALILARISDNLNLSSR